MARGLTPTSTLIFRVSTLTLIFFPILLVPGPSGDRSGPQKWVLQESDPAPAVPSALPSRGPTRLAQRPPERPVPSRSPADRTPSLALTPNHQILALPLPSISPFLVTSPSPGLCYFLGKKVGRAVA